MKTATRFQFATAAGLICYSVLGWAQSSVTIYGVVDAAIQHANTGTGSTTRMDSSSVIPSLVGFKGTEDLGGGLAAIFKLESGFNVDTGAQADSVALFNRESWVGLRGSWGQMQAGVNYSPLFITYCKYSLGDLNTLAWGNATNNFFFMPASRLSNSVRYTSPEMAGFTLSAAASFGNEGATPKNLGETASVGLSYKANAFAFDLDYLQQKYANTAVVTAATPLNQGRYYLFASSYDFDFIKTALIYQAHRSDEDSSTTIGNSYATPENHFYELSATIPHIAGGALMLSYGQYKRVSDSSGNATSYGLRYDYKLSKRTGLYAGVAKIRNNGSASFSVDNAGGAGIATTSGENVNSFIVGMLTSF
jgi:predicted porin